MHAHTHIYIYLPYHPATTEESGNSLGIPPPVELDEVAGGFPA